MAAPGLFLVFGLRDGRGTRVHEGGKKRKKVRNANRNERSQGRSLLRGHGTFSTSKVGGWRQLKAGGWWLVASGGWQLAVDGGPWGLSLRAVLNKHKISGFCLGSLKTALGCGTPGDGSPCSPWEALTGAFSWHGSSLEGATCSLSGPGALTFHFIGTMPHPTPTQPPPSSTTTPPPRTCACLAATNGIGIVATPGLLE